MPAAEVTPRPFGDTDEKTFLTKVFVNRQLEPVEGIWTLTGLSSPLKVAIARNTTETEKGYEYLAVALGESGKLPWQNGELC